MNVQSDSNREITLTRLIAAPRELLFKVFTKADHLARWFGPKGFTVTTHSADIREGGSLYYTMTGLTAPIMPTETTTTKSSPIAASPTRMAAKSMTPSTISK